MPITSPLTKAVEESHLQAARIRQTLFLLGSGFSAAHSMQLGTLVASLAYATDDLATGFLAFLIQQAIEPVTEFATSYFADCRGRRKAVTLGFLSLTLAGFAFVVLTYSLSERSDFLLLVVLAQFAYLLGSAFISGALEAWAVDSLKQAGRCDVNLDALFTQLNFYKNLAIITGGGVGILVLTMTSRAWAPWLLFSSGTLILAWLAWRRMTESQPAESDSAGVPALADALRLIAARVSHNRNLAIYILGWALQYGFWGILAYFWVPLLLLKLEAVALHHWSWAVVAWVLWCAVRIGAATSAVLIVRETVLRTQRVITLCAFATTFSILGYLALAKQLQGYVDLCAFFLAILLSKAFEVTMTGLRMARLNLHIKDAKLRATFISLGFATGALVTLLMLVIGIALLGVMPSTAQHMLWLLGFNAWVSVLGAIVYSFQKA